MKSAIKKKSKLYFVYINTNEYIANLCVKSSSCRKILVWLTFLYFQNQLMCVCSRLCIVMCSIESIILVWNFEFTKKLHVENRKWISCKILHDGLSYIWSNTIEDDFLIRSNIKLNRREDGRIWFFLYEHCFEDDFKNKAEIYLISMIRVHDGVQPCAYIT